MCRPVRLWVDPGNALAAAEVARPISYPADLDGLLGRVRDEPGIGAFRQYPAVGVIVAAGVSSPDLGPIAGTDAVIATGGDSGEEAVHGVAYRRHVHLITAGEPFAQN